MHWTKRLIEKARKEWRETLKTKEDALGRSLGEELREEAKIVGNVVLSASSGDLKGIAGEVAKALSDSPDFVIRTNVEKGLKKVVQTLVTLIMSSGVIERVLEARPEWSEGAVGAVVLTLVTMVVEQVRNYVKVRGPSGVAKYL